MNKHQKIDSKKPDQKWACTECGKEHELPAYVFAHWNEELIHTCECGAKHSVFRGNIMPEMEES